LLMKASAISEKISANNLSRRDSFIPHKFYMFYMRTF